MMSERAGRIVNISSIVAATGYQSLSVYSATKAALIGFTRSLAREVGQLGITVNAVAPGFVDTEMTRELDPRQREQIVRRSALRRLPEPPMSPLRWSFCCRIRRVTLPAPRSLWMPATRPRWTAAAATGKYSEAEPPQSEQSESAGFGH
jgi:NAD(P)-dependent dehydrogenase (short-subunit alcohol dehydrogenase family)